MNDGMEKTASCLAVVEKKPHRPGGCVGIFFQLFDWNRRFAKKKLFSKKLLPPVRLTQASKKFGGDEKQPKIRLIADENSGGFPNAKKNNGGANVDLEQRHETRAPSLVARLMGLESMPALQRGKSKKAGESGFTGDKLENGYQREELNVEKGGIKNEPRPQKLQKTSCSERGPMTRFGTDALPFKNLLARSKKHHPKVPVKSPRNLSRKNSSKLIGAATRILEPGLQRSGSKCALTYSNSLCHLPKENTLLDDLDNCDSVAPTCRNCTNEQSLIFASPSNCVGFSCHGSERSKSLQSKFYQEIKEDLHEDYLTVAAPVLDKSQSSVNFTPDMCSFSEQMQRHFTSQQSKPPKDLRPSLRPSHKTQNQNQIPRGKGTVPSRSKFNSVSSTTVVNERKSFVSSNRSSENCKFEIEERISNRKNEFSSPGRKRRPINNIPKQGESSVFMSPTVKKQTCGTSQEDNNVGSFTFNSPAKKKNGIHAVEKRRVQSDAWSSRSMQKAELSENGTTSKFDKPLHISGDALGAILEQKLKELNCQGEDMGGSHPKKTTAMILQELISALTSEMPFHQNKPEANATTTMLSVDQPVVDEHLSPGSVLEAYSNESSISSNHDDNLGYKMLNESVDCCSSSDPRSINPDSEFSDSANSITGKSSKELVIHIFNTVSETLSCINLANYGVKGSKLDHTREVLLNSELMLQNTTNLGSVAGRDSSIKHLLLDEMETLATVLWMNFGSSLGIQDCQEVNQLNIFAFDSIIEYLELRFERYLKSGSKASAKMPLCVNTNVLLFEIVEEVRRWGELSRFVLDELIEMEMSRSLREWTRCDCETFETGIEISKQVLQILLDEIVMDLCYYYC